MPQSTISLIAFDLDGTVFGSPTNQVVSPRVCAAFQAAHDAGALITVASGRPFWMLGTQIPAAPWLDFAISCNGARVAGTRRCDLDFAASFPRALAEDTLAAIAELGGTVSIHTDAESLMETRHCAHLLDDFDKRKAQASANGAEAADAGFVSLKGHRLVGGMRASIYNAMPKEGVEALVAFLRDFEAKH